MNPVEFAIKVVLALAFGAVARVFVQMLGYNHRQSIASGWVVFGLLVLPEPTCYIAAMFIGLGAAMYESSDL